MKRVKFGPFELDLLTGELSSPDRKSRLTEKPLLALRLLIERAGEVVTRDEMQKRLWSEETFVEFNANMNATIKRLRQALGDSPDAPRFIETIPKVGYRFIAPIERPSRRRAVVGIAAALAVFITLGAQYRKHEPATLTVDAFSNRDPQLSFLANGLSHQVSGHLRRLAPDQLIVIEGAARTDYRLTGSLQGRVLTTSLMQRGRVLWQTTFQLPLQEPFVEHDLARRVAESLSIATPVMHRDQVSHAYTADSNALDAYFHGLECERSGRDAESLQWFEFALKVDPQFAPAFAGIATAKLRIAKSRGQSTDAAANAIDAGLRLDSQIAELHFLRAELSASDSEFRRAIDLDPNDANTRLEYAIFLRERNPIAALAQIDRACELAPVSATAHAWRGSILMFTGKIDDAADQLNAALALDSNEPVTMRFLGDLAERRGDRARATFWFAKAVAASGHQPYYLYRLGVAYAKAGREAEVRNIVDELQRIAQRQFVDPSYINALAAGLRG